MNEIARVMISLEEAQVSPAIIKFPVQEVKALVEKYAGDFKGLHYTDETIKDAKKDKSELNKAKKALSDFAIQTDKMLSANIKEFREEIKEIVGLLEEPIAEIDAKVSEYEERRKELKRDQVLLAIERMLLEFPLEPRYAECVELKSEYLNASMSINKVSEDIQKQIEALKLKQETCKLQISQIEQAVEMANLKHQPNVKLVSESFVAMLEYKTFEDTKELIERTAEKQRAEEVAYVERVKVEEERKAAEKVRLEQEAAELEHKKELEDAEAAEKKAMEELYAMQAAKEQAEALAANVVEQVDSIIPSEKQESEPIYKATFKVRGSKDQLEKLIKYFQMAEIEYEKL